jgi:hypothetical protein
MLVSVFSSTVEPSFSGARRISPRSVLITAPAAAGRPTAKAAREAAVAAPPDQVRAWRRDTPANRERFGASKAMRIEVGAERLGRLAHHRQRLGAQQRALAARIALQPSLERCVSLGVNGPRSSRAVHSDAA